MISMSVDLLADNGSRALGLTPFRRTSHAPMPLTTTGMPGASDLIHSISLH